jgi:hypothetical protein
MLGADADDIDAVVGHVRRGKERGLRGGMGEGNHIMYQWNSHVFDIFLFLSSTGRDP